MKNLQAVVIILWLISLPIGMFITYSVLSQLDTDRLVWFLYWVNIPIIVITTILARLIEED